MTVRELEAWAIAHPNMPQANAVLELITNAVKCAVELATVVAKIQAWEMLNPPRVDLLPDLGWLKAVVMKVNLTGGAGAQPNES